MAPLNPNSTPRLKIFYDNAIAQHDVIVRVMTVGDIAEAETIFQQVTGEVEDAMCFSEVTAVQFAADNSDIFLDLTSTTLIGYTWGLDPATLDTNPVALTFVGRGTTGRRARFSLFGYKNALSQYRITGAESNSILNSVTALNGATGSFVAVDSTQPVWKNYANVKAFDHWVKESRGG
jgi:hypothetical protein